MKSHLRKTRASGSTIQKIERIARQGEASMRRSMFASNRAKKFYSQDAATSQVVNIFETGGFYES